MPKITFIGAGSTVFTKTLAADVLSYPELADATLTLFDIDQQRLATSEAVVRRVADAWGVRPIIEATVDRERALDGADYALNMIQVGGFRPATVTDFEIPKRYGLRQTIGDTAGVGGIMRAVRTIPVLLEMQRDMERLCPQVVHLNHVNPMAMNTWALNAVSPIRTVGLCHSVPHTARELANDLDLPADEIDYKVAGINHLAFFLRLEHQGCDLYPRLHELVEQDRVPPWNRVRYELFRRVGFFVTESSEHLAEYVPWIIKSDRPELIERFNVPLDEYPGRCRLYEVAWAFLEDELRDPGVHDADELRRAVEREGIEVMPRQVDHLVNGFRGLGEVRRSGEYASGIIHALETGAPRTVYANVANRGAVENLPIDACVEVPCLVDGNGVQPTHVGKLPSQLAALMRPHVDVQRLTVEAVLEGDRERLYHAAMVDPHTAAELPLGEIWSLVDELLEAHGSYVPEALR